MERNLIFAVYVVRVSGMEAHTGEFRGTCRCMLVQDEASSD